MPLRFRPPLLSHRPYRDAISQDLIEIQPAYEQLPWEVDWAVEGQGHSSKARMGRIRGYRTQSHEL